MNVTARRQLAWLSLPALLLAGAALVGLDRARADEARAQVGQPAPAFTLRDLDGQEHSLAALKGKIVVLEWFNADCPFVKKHHQLNKTMRDLAARYRDRDVVWLAINSNKPGSQGAGLDRNQRAVTEYGIAYPVLLDETSQVGLAYGARTTPHMYVIDREGVLVYAGAIDDNAHATRLGETNYVAQALDAVLAGQPVPTPSSRAYGCSVKYP